MGKCLRLIMIQVSAPIWPQRTEQEYISLQVRIRLKLLLKLKLIPLVYIYFYFNYCFLILY